jgi:hypothetical protein
MEITAQLADVMDVMEQLNPIIFYPDRQAEDLVSEIPHQHEQLEVAEPSAHDIQLVVPELPGRKGPIDEEFERSLEVADNATVESNQTYEAKDEPKDEQTPWGWEKVLKDGGCEAFLGWIRDRLGAIPGHSGKDKAGLLRAEAYLEKLASEVSKAMRADLDGKIDADKIEVLLKNIEDGIDSIYDRIEKLSESKKKGKKKKAGVEFGIVKEAQKAPSLHGIIITVPLLISRIARVLINGMVQGGHDLQDMYKQQCDKYDLNEREKAEVQQLLLDMNMPLFPSDRGLIADKDVWDGKSENNFDYTPQYPG